MPRQKENFETRVQTTARVPDWLHKDARKLCVDLDIDLIDAINQGLIYWIAHSTGSKALRIQMEDAAGPMLDRLKAKGAASGELEKKAKPIKRSGTTG